MNAAERHLMRLFLRNVSSQAVVVNQKTTRMVKVNWETETSRGRLGYS